MPNKVNSKINTNFSNVIKNLSPNSQKDLPWYKRKVSIIGMSSTLGVGVLATAIAVPIVLTSKSSSPIIVPPIASPEEQQAIIDQFNAKPLTEKISSYNSMVENPINKVAIVNYFLDYKITGFNSFFLANIDENRDNTSVIYNEFKTFLATSNTSSIINPFLKQITLNAGNNDVILNMIGTGPDSISLPNIFFSTLFTDITYHSFSMYSPIIGSIANLIINNDFSIKISFGNVGYSTIASIVLTDGTTGAASTLLYKQDIVLNNTTLFPNMQEYVRSKILNIK